MKIKYTLKTSLVGLKTHKTRSALTVLGIVIGIAAIILMMSIGQGAEALILKEIGGLGAETMVVRPGKEPTGPSDIGGTIFANSLKSADIQALKQKGNVPYLAEAAPILIVPGSISYEGETFRPMILGSSAEFFADAFNVYPEIGEIFSENEIRRNASVAVIGFRVADELFGGSDAVGEYVKINKKKFRVAGVFPPKGQTAFMDFDKLVIIPYTTAQTYLLGIDYFHEIMIKASSPEMVARTVEDIKETLRERHGITHPDNDDFFVVTQEGMVKKIQTIIGALTAFLSSAVAIALVVGGIGVMNIMLVSVTERTREIGLRKAVGATKKDISRQFLLEAIILTGIGGVVGILLGAFMSFIVSLVLNGFLALNWPFVFPVSAAILGLSVSVAVGLVFGIYPARQASRKSPIEALRHE